MFKLKARKFWGLIRTFVEVTGEKVVRGGFLNRVMNTFPICPALQFMIVNEIKRFVLYCLSTILGYVQGDLRKRQLMGSFAEQFNVKSFFQAFFAVILSGLVVAKLSFFQAYY